MGLFSKKPPKQHQKSQSGSGNTAQTSSSGAQDNLNRMLENGQLSPEDYAKIVENRQ